MTTLSPIRDALKCRLAQLAAANATQRDTHAEILRLRQEIASLENLAREKRALELTITDHALLRYAERVLGFDRHEVATLIRDHVTTPWLHLGDGKFPVCPGFHAVVKDRTVVTIEPA